MDTHKTEGGAQQLKWAWQSATYALSINFVFNAQCTTPTLICEAIKLAIYILHVHGENSV